MNGSRREPHILMLAPLFAPFKGAVSSRLSSFAKCWVNLTRVTVVSPYSGDILQQGYNRIKVPLARWRIEPLRIPFTFPKLLTLARNLNPDIIFTSMPPVWALLEGYLLARRFGCPLILDVRDLPQATLRASKTFILRQIFEVFQVALARHLGRKASRIVTVTDWVRDELVKFLRCPSGKTFVIRNGSDAALFAKALSVKKEFDLVYSGTLISIRNPAGILKYLHSLAELYPSVRILFSSDLNNKLGEKFLRGIDKLGLSDNVVIQTMCAPEDLPRRLGQARLGFTSLKSGEYAYRGVASSKNYEYLASGLPVIGLLDPDFYIETKHLIADSKAGILNSSPERLAIETAALLKDPVRLRRMSKQARKLGERFDRKRLAEEYYYKVILPVWQESSAKR